jgi:hypothetical protein
MDDQPIETVIIRDDRFQQQSPNRCAVEYDYQQTTRETAQDQQTGTLRIEYRKINRPTTVRQQFIRTLNRWV